jgi:hypothetical protein
MPLEIQRNAVLAQDKKSYGGPKVTLDVIHNYAHDCESYWWLILWLLMERIPGEASADFVRRVFQNVIEPSDFRSRTFIYGDTLEDEDLNVHPAVTPLLVPLLIARQDLVINHQTRSRDTTKSLWGARSEYIMAFGAVRALVRSVQEVAEAAPLDSDLRHLKTYRKEVPQDDDHRSAQAPAMTSGKGKESSSGSLIPPQRVNKRGRSTQARDDAAWEPEDKRPTKIRSVTKASTPRRAVQNPALGTRPHKT